PGDRPGHRARDAAPRSPARSRAIMTTAPAAWLDAVRREAPLRDRLSTATTVAVSVTALYVAVRVAGWACVHAVSRLPGARSAPCRALRGAGACWAVVGERSRFILWGGYPLHEQWRAMIACGLLIALYAASANRAWWRPWLIAAWVSAPIAAIAVLRGGI